VPEFRPCALIPTYDNPRTLRAVVERVRAQVADVVVVDDGSAEPGRREAARLAEDGLARVTRRARNGGKGAAVKTGFRFAHELGYTHALQVDADGQHALADIPRFLEAAARAPEALILGAPIYDHTAPRGRLVGRKITLFWTRVEAGRDVIADPMCGFRVYPLAAALAAPRTGDRMDFDIEIAVRMAWMGVPIVNLPTKVRYLSREEGGVSHFRMFRDNVRISWMHTRLACTALFWRPLLRLVGRAPRRLPAAR
jgi:polyprenyl-phospho-N-acetylgalactosaminyl synthase